MANNDTSISRDIHFFRISRRGKGERPAGPVNWADALTYIDGLSFDDGSRYLEQNRYDPVALWVDRKTTPQHAHFGVVRRDTLPRVEQSGTLKPLDIPDEAGLSEHMHLVFFKDGVVGAEFNFYGPRVSRLRQYLNKVAPDHCAPLVVRQLLRNDVLKQLDSKGSIRLVRLRIKRSYADTVAKASKSLGAALKACGSDERVEEVEIGLRAAPRTKSKFLDDDWKSAIKKLLGQKDARENVQKATVQFEGDLKEVNLLEDKLVKHVEMLATDGRTRVIVPQSAYAAITTAYNSVKPLLADAVEVEV